MKTIVVYEIFQRALCGKVVFERMEYTLFIEYRIWVASRGCHIQIKQNKRFQNEIFNSDNKG